ncbi:secreted protein containing CHASE4 domain protein, partial [Candidatus Magnetoovum chiemensis]
MTLYRKTILIFALAFIVLIGMFYVLSELFIIDSYSRLELENSLKSIKRANKALELVITNIEKQCIDWARWDDIYQYVYDHNKKFEYSNVQETTLSGTKLNFIIITDSDFNVIIGKQFDLDTSEFIDFSPSFSKLLTKNSAILNRAIKEITSGIIMIDDKPLLLSAQPITNTDATAKPNGVLIFARFLDDELINAGIKEVTSLNVTIAPLTDPSAEKNLKLTKETDVSGEPLRVYTTN